MNPIVYDRQMNRIGTLQHALSVSYTHVCNDLWTASLALPAKDEENELCQEIHAIIDIRDGNLSAGKYRVREEPVTEYRAVNAVHTYSLEHVLAFLLDDRIDGYLELGGMGITTEMVIRELLSRQSETRWQLGDCEFSYAFQYAWENEDLLSAIYSIPTCFADSYHWEFETDSYPFTLHLRRGEAEPGCELRYGRNERGIRRGRNTTNLCTRLYCLGSGEGVNQTTIKDAAANTSGKSYIDSPNIQKYGVISRHLIDPSISNPDLLYEKGLAILRELEEPIVTYTISAVDLHRITGLDWDRMEEGRCIRIADPGLGIDTNATIIEYSKGDVLGSPLEATIVIANKTEDVASQIENLSQRTAIQAQYAQGATNLFPLQIMDNADERHPARLKFYIPESCRKINRVLLSYSFSPFRAFSTGAAAGGGDNRTTAGGGESTQTSSAGGESTETSTVNGESTQTSSGASTSKGTTATRTIVETFTTSSPLQDGNTSDYSGGPVNALGSSMTETDAATGNTGSSGELTTGAPRNSSGAMTSTGAASGTTGGTSLVTGGARNGDGAMVNTGSSGSHSHTVSVDSHHHYFSDSETLAIGHTHYVSGVSRNTGGMSTNYSKTVSISGNTGNVSPGGSTGSNGSHSHSMSHWHNIDSHTHTIGSHTHGMSHWHTIDGHTHTLGSHKHKFVHQHRFPHSHTVRVAVDIPALEVTLEGHTHTVKIPGHSHKVTLPSHTHTVQIPSHTHSFTLQSHTHDIVYGIYEGNMASRVTVRVDGQEIPSSELLDAGGHAKTEIDVVPYLRMSGGRIVRGTWHEIELVPDKLTRIEANLFVQTFITSWSGGSY